jgi:hypothetical protein
MRPYALLDCGQVGVIEVEIPVTLIEAANVSATPLGSASEASTLRPHTLAAEGRIH